jgi:hypothetical protein
MADTMGHSPDRSATAVRNTTAAIGVLVLALTPQLFELLWSIGAQLAAVLGIAKFTGRGLLQVLWDHGSALLLAAPHLGTGSFGAGAKLSSDTLLALIYSYPLFAVAILTLFVKPKAPQDYFGGIALMAIALFALWASSDLQGMRGFSFGAGSAPRMFGVLLLVLGFAIAGVGLLIEGPHLATYAWRGPLFVSLSILCFAVSIRPLGLIISAFASFMIAALGTPETKWKETIIVGLCLTAFCSLLFPYALGLPLQMKPWFMIR